MKLLLQYLKTLTFRRFFNLISCEISYLVSIILRRDIVWGLPWSVSIEPTTSCNLKCQQCTTGAGLITRAKGNLNFESFKTILNKVEKSIVYLTLYFQGEPFLNSEIFEMISYARKRKVFVCTSTNGHYLNEEFSRKLIDSGLNKLIISIDGTTQESYSKYRKNGNLETVMSGLDHLLLQKKLLKSSSPFIEIQFIVFKHNEHEIDDIMKLAQLEGVDRVVLKSAQIVNEEDFEDLLPSNQSYSRYKKTSEGLYVRKKSLKNYCHRVRNSSVITWDGNVVPCCFAKNAEYSYGNIFENSFSKIYKNNNARYFRNTILKDRIAKLRDIEICRNCSE